MSDYFKKLSKDTKQEIVRAEKYVKDLKKFRASIDPRTAPRKKKKNLKKKNFIVVNESTDTSKEIISPITNASTVEQIKITVA